MSTLFGSTGTSKRGGGTSLFGGVSLGGEDEDKDPYSISSIQKQIGNAELRVNDAGINPEDSNKRNWFEKATNLPAGQNAFFDTLDIITRGGNAVKNVIDKTLIKDREGVGTAIYRGLSGRERVSGADLMKQAGEDSKLKQFGGGLVADIALDPLTYVPGGVIAKGIGAVVKPVAGAAKSAYGALEAASPALKTLRETKLEPWSDAAKDGLGHIFKPQYKWDETLTGGKDDTLKTLFGNTNNEIKYMNEESLKNVGQIAKTTGLDAGDDVGRLMEKDLKDFVDVKGYEFPDGITRTDKKSDLLDVMKVNRAKIEDSGKTLNDFTYTSPASITTGMKAYELTEKAIPATRRTPASTTLVKTKGSIAKEIEEIKDINGVPSYRFKGEQAFVPATKVRPLGEQSLTTIGSINKQISETVSDLGKVESQIRKQYFSKESAALRQLTTRKNKPLNLDELAQSNAMGKVSVSPAFNYLLKQREEIKTSLATLRQSSKDSKSGIIDQIKKTADENTALKESIRNPVMMQKEFERPVRTMPTEPNVTQAAQSLIDSNKTVRDWAVSNDIPVGEIEGYMKHIRSVEERTLRKTREGKMMDRARNGMNNPDKGVLKGRTLPGSAEDVNERVGRKLFETNAYFSTAIGQKKLIEYGAAVKFRREILSNPNFSKKYTGGTPSPGTEVINTNNYRFMKDPNGALPEEIGGEYLVTKGVKESLDRYQKMATDEGSKAFLKVYDTIQSTWKRFALFSPGYHVRNLAGAMFNNSIAGMNSVDLLKYTPKSMSEVVNYMKGKESSLFNEYRRQGLSSSGLSKVEFAKAGEEPEQAVRKTVESMSKSTSGKVLERLNPLKAFKTSQELGDFMDQTNRFALYKWAREKKGMTPKAATEKVKETQFDYSNLTPVEQSTIARLVPFYRWMRNNIPFQIKSFINDPRKYANVDKTRQEAQQAVGLDDENMPQYMKEQFNIPLFGKNGVGKSLGLNLPLTDLMKLSSPLKTLTDSISPVIKAPIELATNYNMFYKKPIQKFDGQEKQFSLGGVNLGGIPIKTAYALEQATGQVGRGLSDYLQKSDQKDNDTTFRVPSLGVSSILKPFDAEEAKRLEQLQKLKRLQDLMLYIEQQQGSKPRTLNEIRKGIR